MNGIRATSTIVKRWPSRGIRATRGMADKAGKGGKDSKDWDPRRDPSRSIDPIEKPDPPYPGMISHGLRVEIPPPPIDPHRTRIFDPKLMAHHWGALPALAIPVFSLTLLFAAIAYNTVAKPDISFHPQSYSTDPRWAHVNPCEVRKILPHQKMHELPTREQVDLREEIWNHYNQSLVPKRRCIPKKPDDVCKV